MTKRIYLIFIIFLIFTAALISRLFYLQISQGEFYKALAKGQHIYFQEIEGERGKIFFEDKNGRIYPVAFNKSYTFLYVSPREIKEKEKTAQVLAEMTGEDQKIILEKLKKDNLFEIIKNDLTNEEVERIKQVNLKGVYLSQRTGRFYPYQELASKILGFVDVDGNGQYGIEGFYDKLLKGKRGFLEEEKGVGGKLIFFDPGRLIPAQAGNDLILALDYNLQFKAERLLESAKEDLDIEGGTIIVMNPQTGEIKALANFPNYDPNHYSETPMEIFLNDAVQKIFEPGSVFKPFTMAMGLDLEVISPETTYIDEGAIKLKGGVIYNYNFREYGKQTMTNVLEKSINTGAVFVERKVGSQNFLDYLKKFGFEEPTGIDLPGEIYSENRNLKSGREINLATAAFGQGIEMTPIQLVRSFAVLINAGKLWRPYTVKKIVMPDGQVKETRPTLQREGIIKEETSEKLVEMLINVVEKGFGKGARIPGYYIGGKTGTAQVPWTSLGIDKPGYSDKTIQSFMGFFPAYDPQFLVFVKLNNPKTRTAEYSAVPLFRELAKYIIDYYQIPPDY